MIFIDEFQVEDIADAMILGDLLMYAIKNNTYLYFTSNAKPSELYKNGLQRQKFLPCIDLIEANTNVMSLKGVFDYRSRNIAEIKESFFETSNDINEFLRKNMGKVLLLIAITFQIIEIFRLAVLFQMSLFGFLLKIFSLNPLAQRITLKSVWTLSGFLLMILISVTMIIMML